MKKYIIYLFFIVVSFLALYRRIGLGFVCLDIDEYMIQFNDFITVGFYTKVSEGTSIVYNLVISWIYFFVKDISKSFYIVNVISQLLIGGLGFLIIKKSNQDSKNYLILFGLYFFLLWVNDEKHTLSRNDIFLGFLIMMVYHIILLKKINTWISILIGFLLGLLLSTRLFSIILIPSVFLFLFMNKDDCKLKNITTTSIVFLLTLLSLNYPSIKEHHKLSFYDKNKRMSQSDNFTWSDINTLATLRMFDEDKVEILTKNIYWGWNKEKVEFYKEKYNIVESPQNIFDFIIKYPVYYLKLVMLNILNLLFFFFRRYGFMLILPLIYSYMEIKKERCKFFKKAENLPFFMFLLSTGILVFIINTVIEFRWLISIEFLLTYAIYISYNNLVKNSVLKTKINYILYSSLFCLTIFNLRTIINIFY